MLFNLYAKHIFNTAFFELILEVTINGRTLYNIHYADNAAILVDNVSNLRILLDELNKVGKQLVKTLMLRKTSG